MGYTAVLFFHLLYLFSKNYRMCQLPLILLLLNCCSAEKINKISKTKNLLNQLENSPPLKRSKKKNTQDLPVAKVGFTKL